MKTFKLNIPTLVLWMNAYQVHTCEWHEREWMAAFSLFNILQLSAKSDGFELKINFETLCVNEFIFFSGSFTLDAQTILCGLNSSHCNSFFCPIFFFISIKKIQLIHLNFILIRHSTAEQSHSTSIHHPLPPINTSRPLTKSLQFNWIALHLCLSEISFKNAFDWMWGRSVRCNLVSSKAGCDQLRLVSVPQIWLCVCVFVCVCVELLKSIGLFFWIDEELIKVNIMCVPI